MGYKTGRTRIHELPKWGQRYGRLQVISFASGGETPGSRSYVLCKCDCGKEKRVYVYNLYRGFTKSCGCICAEIVSARRTTHGQTETRLYEIWSCMKQRCSDTAWGTSRKDYFNRGIRVCPEWIAGFESFRDWATANGYDEKLSIDRIDNNGNYEPSNCRWVTRSQNNRNTRNTRYVTAFGETKCVAEWAEDPRCKVKPYRLYWRFNHAKMSPEDCITTPTHRS
jgi:hypothetical protein